MHQYGSTDGYEKYKKAGDAKRGEVQMSNTKYQLKPQYLMSNFEFCHSDLGI